MRRGTTGKTLAILATLAMASVFTETLAQTVSVSMTEGPQMSVPRMNHIQLLLPDGKVALLGGHTTGFANLYTADIWDPATNTFTSKTMKAKRDWSAITRLLYGDYLIAGGTDEGGSLPGTFTAEVFDPSTMTFHETQPMGTQRSHCSAATIAIGPTEIVFSNENTEPVVGSPSSPTTFTLDNRTFIAEVWTSHWNDGHGTAPGTISLRHADGDTYGPWETRGREGQGGVVNAYWVAEPRFDIREGTYTVIDSDPASWSHNANSNGKGFARVVKGRNVDAGNAVVVGGRTEGAAATADLFDLTYGGIFWNLWRLRTPRCNAVLFPADSGGIVICGGNAYNDLNVHYEQVEICYPGADRFYDLQDTLFPGETGWKINTYTHKRPVDTFQLNDGRYIFAAESLTTPNLITLGVFDPSTEQFSRLPVNPEFSEDEQASFLMWPLLDSAKTKLCLLRQNTSGSQRNLSVDVVDLLTGTRFRGLNAFTLPDDYYFFMTGETLLPDGRIFITGGHSQPGGQSNYTPVRRTFFLTPHINAPQDQLVGELVLHVQLTSGWDEPEGRPVRYRYEWVSSGSDPAVTRGPKPEMEDVLRPGDSGVTFDPGETWTVTITAVNDQETEGPSISAQYRIDSNQLVLFEGWILQ